MKKIILQLSTGISFALLALFPKVAFATDAVPICPPGDFSSLCDLKPEKGGSILSSAITVMLILAIVVTLFFLVMGGIKWTASGGDKSKIESARHSIIASIVGLVVALLAYFIVNVVLAMFTGKGLDSLSLPTLY